MNNLFRNILKKRKFVLMAEIKFKSPSKGVLGRIEEIEKIAKEYEKGGADVISVVIAKKYFDGDLQMIQRVKRKVGLPVFAKDFVTTELQLKEIRNAGADAVLLLANIVSKEKLNSLYLKAENLGMTPVVEVDNRENLEAAIKAKFPVIAINARNLKDFSVDIKKAIELIKTVPKEIICLAFSGVRNKSDIENYVACGANGVLIGTALMKSQDKKGFLEEVRDL